MTERGPARATTPDRSDVARRTLVREARWVHRRAVHRFVAAGLVVWGACGCGPSPDSETFETESLSCAGECTGVLAPTTQPDAPPRIYRQQPLCETLVVRPDTRIPFLAPAEVLPALDGGGGVVSRQPTGGAVWFVDGRQNTVTTGPGPYLFDTSFRRPGSHTVAVLVVDMAGARSAVLEWTIEVQVGPPPRGPRGNGRNQPNAPYLCGVPSEAQRVDVVVGESRRVRAFVSDADADLLQCDWRLDGAEVGSQTMAALAPEGATSSGGTCYYDAHQATTGSHVLDLHAISRIGQRHLTRPLVVGPRGRTLVVEDLAARLMGTDPNAEIYQLLSFLTSQGFNSVAMGELSVLLADHRCVNDPSAVGCMPLASLLSALDARTIQAEAIIDSAATLDVVMAFQVATSEAFDGLSTRCRFWEGDSGCAIDGFDDADAAAVDTYMELVGAMRDTMLPTASLLGAVTVEQAVRVAAAVDRIDLDATAPSGPDCHYREVEGLLEAMARPSGDPVEVHVTFSDAWQRAEACVGSDGYAAFGDWEEDFYARLRGEGLKACSWAGARRPWFDGVRVTGFQYPGYAALVDRLTDSDCDAEDDDCDGATDEAYAVHGTECGVGACASVGATSCAAGVVSDSCTPLDPSPDTTCDGVDDDCDGMVDEEFVSHSVCDFDFDPPACGQTTCIDGVLGDDIVRPACNLAACPVPESECQEAACVDFQCAVAPLDDGTVCSEVTDGLCVEGACVPPGCGNGFREPSERCDDGNLVNGDACTDTCESDFLFIDGSLGGAYDPVPPSQAPVFGVDGRGGLLAAWIRDAYSSEELHVRRYTRGGVSLEPVGDDTLLLDGALFRPSNADPVVAGLGTGGWVVVWSALRGGNRNIVYRIVHPDGSLDPERTANTEYLGTQWRPSVATTSEGFVIAWVDTVDSDGDANDGVRARRFGANGLPLDAPIYLASERSDWESRVAVAGDPDSELWAAAWTQGFDTRIQVRRFDGALTLDAAERDASGHLSDRPAIASLGNGEFVVAWESYAADGDGDIESRVLSASSGDLLVNPILVHAEVPGERELRPSVVRWSLGEYAVAWWQPDAVPTHVQAAISPGVVLPPEMATLAERVDALADGHVGLAWAPGGVWMTWNEYIDPYFTPILTGFLLPRSTP